MSRPERSSSVLRQFSSAARLFSSGQFSRLRQAHVGVVGLGGVGSWAAEALVRSGLGAITLVDMDHVAESNLNRQVQALHSTLGAAKCDSLKQRLLDIAPDCLVTVLDMFLAPENADGLITKSAADVWIDATDDLAAKRAMILVLSGSKRLKDLVVSGGAGGTTDPTRISAADLSEAVHDPLLSSLRYDLRKNHGFPRTGKTKIQVVFSSQPVVKAEDCDPMARLACAGYGSLVTVTASMGMAAAQQAMVRLIKSA
jgi:tRNA A37 threonylcarbamoyladenosine dehydratase